MIDPNDGSFFQHGVPTLYDAQGSALLTTSAPAASTNGVDCPLIATEIAWYVNAAAETNVCTVQPWTYNPVRTNWVKQGDPIELNGSQLITVYVFGTRTELQITAAAGTYSRDYIFINKEV